MKHAGEETLTHLEPLLKRVRRFTQLKEKSRGVFYQKSKAFLHFHDDPEGIFADVQKDGSWQRLKISTKSDHETLLALIEESLQPKSP